MEASKTSQSGMILKTSEIVSGYEQGPDIIKGVSIGVQKGEIVVLIGPNGCGKSTLLRTVSGILKLRSGKLEFSDTGIEKLRADQRLRLGLTHVAQERSVFPKLTVYENLMMGGFIIKDRKEVTDRVEEVAAKFPLLNERRRQKAGTMSGGEQRLLEIARALILQPRLLLLDEPSLGLEPKFRKLIFDTVQKLNDSGLAILIVEQNAKSALKIADRAYAMELGRVRFEGTSEEILNNPAVQELYLGRSLVKEATA